ncbi:MAG: hypothetical protein WDN04_20045 [Rhodospirillales bacterium]
MWARPKRCATGWPTMRCRDDHVMAHALDVAARLAALPPLAFARMKAGLRRIDMAAALARESDAQAACLTGAEFAEGYDAFTSKRAPIFAAPAARAGKTGRTNMIARVTWGKIKPGKWDEFARLWNEYAASVKQVRIARPRAAARRRRQGFRLFDFLLGVRGGLRCA